jgi:hypothetical protein
MPDPTNLNATSMASNGWERRLRSVLIVVDVLAEKPARLTVVLLAVGLLLYMGYLPSALTRIENKVDGHDAAVTTIVARTVVTDEKLAAILNALIAQMAERNRRDRIRECAEIQDGELRRLCLEVPR